MMTNEYHNASGAYKTAHHKTLTKMEIVFALYRGLLNNIETAKNAYIAHDFEKMSQVNEKAIAILIALQGSLDLSKNEVATKNLNVFYTAVYVKISGALGVKNPVEAYDDAYSNVKDVYSHWFNLYTKYPHLFDNTTAKELA